MAIFFSIQSKTVLGAGRLPCLHVNCEPLQSQICKMRCNSHIGGIPAIGDDDPATTWPVLGGIEGIPTPADESLEPGMQIHGLQLIKVSDDHPGWNIQAAA